MSIIGANPLKEHFMKLSSLGEISLSLVPQADNPEIYQVCLGAENRKDVINMVTNKDETADQLCLRLRGMLRAILQGEPRAGIPAKVPEEKVTAKSWRQQKADMKGAKGVQPDHLPGTEQPPSNA